MRTERDLLIRHKSRAAETFRGDHPTAPKHCATGSLVIENSEVDRLHNPRLGEFFSSARVNRSSLAKMHRARKWQFATSAQRIQSIGEVGQNLETIKRH